MIALLFVCLEKAVDLLLQVYSGVALGWFGLSCSPHGMNTIQLVFHFRVKPPRSVLRPIAT